MPSGQIVVYAFCASKKHITISTEGKIMITVASLFSQLLHHFPRTEFAHLVAKYQAERKAKGFTCWTQLVAMLFCHMARADSLREIMAVSPAVRVKPGSIVAFDRAYNDYSLFSY